MCVPSFSVRAHLSFGTTGPLRWRLLEALDVTIVFSGPRADYGLGHHVHSVPYRVDIFYSSSKSDVYGLL